jgi:predicted lipoprotein
MNRVVYTILAVSVLFTACKKNDDTPSTEVSFTEMEQTVLNDFTNKVAVSGYSELKDNADALYTALNDLNTNATEDNLNTARTAWKSMRTTWEQCEGFLFGPVEDNDYDPNMDTWPTDYHQMDSLLASNNGLTLADIQNATLSLRGFHPIEYIIFGVGGSRTAASITDRQKQYMISLATDLKNTCHALYDSWAGTEDFAGKVTGAGNGSDKYAKKQEVYLAILGAMTDICSEVGEGKMAEPFGTSVANADSNIVESPYSGNSAIDFKNNIVGLRNVYMGKDNGKGLSYLVSSKNKDLDNRIQNEINAAINSFDNITVPYGQAIYSQRTQVQNIMTALATLKATLEGDLNTFVQQYITD